MPVAVLDSSSRVVAAPVCGSVLVTTAAEATPPAALSAAARSATVAVSLPVRATVTSALPTTSDPAENSSPPAEKTPREVSTVLTTPLTATSAEPSETARTSTA